MQHLKQYLSDQQWQALQNHQSRDGFVVVDATEFAEMVEYFAEFDVYHYANHKLIPIFTDNQSNYWCLYVEGCLQGKVCYLNHSEPSFEPKFASLDNLLSTIANNSSAYDFEDLAEIQPSVFDFPNFSNFHSMTDEQLANQIAKQNEIIQTLWQAYSQQTDDECQIQTAFAILALLNQTNYKLYLPTLLADEDMYIKERAEQIQRMLRDYD